MELPTTQVQRLNTVTRTVWNPLVRRTPREAVLTYCRRCRLMRDVIEEMINTLIKLLTDTNHHYGQYDLYLRRYFLPSYYREDVVRYEREIQLLAHDEHRFINVIGLQTLVPTRRHTRCQAFTDIDLPYLVNNQGRHAMYNWAKWIFEYIANSRLVNVNITLDELCLERTGQWRIQVTTDRTTAIPIPEEYQRLALVSRRGRSNSIITIPATLRELDNVTLIPNMEEARTPIDDQMQID